jgi:hypothetical protein
MFAHRRASPPVGRDPPRRYHACMAFERPAPDLRKLLAAWESWEKGEENPGKVLANLKTAGLAEVLAELSESGWTPAVK